jgi:hypothetical protein
MATKSAAVNHAQNAVSLERSCAGL